MKEDILILLKKVIDPELRINVVDLGLIYSIMVEPSDNKISIEYTLTSPGCMMGEIIAEECISAIKSKYPLYSINAQLVWEPAWSTEKITLEGKKFLSSTR
jgi:metal-sulfur cluster biosynthetic enzyme